MSEETNTKKLIDDATQHVLQGATLLKTAAVYAREELEVGEVVAEMLTNYALSIRQLCYEAGELSGRFKKKEE